MGFGKAKWDEFLQFLVSYVGVFSGLGGSVGWDFVIVYPCSDAKGRFLPPLALPGAGHGPFERREVIVFTEIDLHGFGEKRTCSADGGACGPRKAPSRACLHCDGRNFVGLLCMTSPKCRLSLFKVPCRRPKLSKILVPSAP